MFGIEAFHIENSSCNLHLSSKNRFYLKTPNIYYGLVGEVMVESNMLPLVGIYFYISTFGGSNFSFLVYFVR